MGTQPITKPSDTYKDFRELHPEAWYRIIRFYESRCLEMESLPVSEHLRICDSYAEALYRIGDHTKLLEVTDSLIDMSMEGTLSPEYSREIFQRALLRKSNVHIRLLEYSKAEKILHQLVNMNPENRKHRWQLSKCKFMTKPNWIRKARACSILCFLISALVILIEILVIQLTYPEYLDFAIALRVGLFALGLGILIFSEVIHGISSILQVKRQANSVKR